MVSSHCFVKTRERRARKAVDVLDTPICLSIVLASCTEHTMMACLRTVFRSCHEHLGGVVEVVF